MTRAPDWTIEEFEILIKNNHLSHEQLAQLLPGRTLGGIESVRQGIHLFHSSDNGSMLSEIMRQRLKEKRQSQTCPICKTQL